VKKVKNADWKAFAELVGIAAIVVSLVFVALQLRQSQDIAIAETRTARQAALVELNNAIAEHAETWAKGNSGEELSRSENVVYERLIVSTHFQYWTTFSRSRRFDQEVPLALNIADFAFFLHENLGARQTWTRYIENRESARAALASETGYSQNQFASLVFTDLAKLDALSE
jgi:hypothetical protein